MMDRTAILDAMGALKLYGMRAGYDDILTAAVKRQHEPQRVVGDLLAAELSEKQARSIKYQMTIAKLPFAKEVDEFDFDGAPVTQDPTVRKRLARIHLRGEYLKLLADRAVSGALHGRAAGPESSLAKLLWNELEQEISTAATELLGPAGLSGPWARDRLASRSYTIAGGTTQVNKNVVAQRILGLPRA